MQDTFCFFVGEPGTVDSARFARLTEVGKPAGHQLSAPVDFSGERQLVGEGHLPNSH